MLALEIQTEIHKETEKRVGKGINESLLIRKESAFRARGLSKDEISLLLIYMCFQKTLDCMGVSIYILDKLVMFSHCILF